MQKTPENNSIAPDLDGCQPGPDARHVDKVLEVLRMLRETLRSVVTGWGEWGEWCGVSEKFIHAIVQRLLAREGTGKFSSSCDSVRRESMRMPPKQTFVWPTASMTSSIL